MLYLSLFDNLRMCDGYAWGVATLTLTYDQLSNAYFAQPKQLRGYITMLEIDNIHNLNNLDFFN